MAFPGGGRIPFGGGASGVNNSPSYNEMTEEQREMQMIKTMSALMESCPAKAAISCGAGFALGGLFGMFMASMSYDTMAGAGAQQLANLPLRQQLRHGLKDMGTRSYSSAKNFAVVGGIFAGTECCIESYRAKNDMVNGISAGCITGGVLAHKAGPQAAAIGCAGFAAFSAAIDYWLRSD